jgi:hypothetical protein
MKKKARLITIAMSSLGVFTCGALISSGACKIYRSNVTGAGVGGDVYIHTFVWACVSDNAGHCNAKGGYLYIKNQSSTQSYRWSSTAAGEPMLQPLAPNQVAIHYLSAYRQPNEAVVADLEVELCE